MNSPLFEEWVKEERDEAAEAATKENMIEQLNEKFDFLPRNIRESIGSIDDIDILRELNRKTIKVETMEDLRELINKVQRLN